SNGISNGQKYTNAVNMSRPTEPIGPSSRRTPLVISEIMYDPPSGQSQFIEIYNSTYREINLDGYKITGDVSFDFPNQFKLPAKAFYKIDAVQFQSGSSLDRTAGTVRLRSHGDPNRAADAIMLEVKYRNDAPWPVAAAGAGHSIVLARPSYGEDDP